MLPTDLSGPPGTIYRMNRRGPLPGAQREDPPWWRLAFGVGPWWLTLWLLLILGAAVVLAIVAGPWVPGAITAAGAIAGGARAITKNRR